MPCHTYNQAIAQSNFFWIIVNPVQIHQKYVIANPNPITIQQFLEKDMGQQIFNGQVL